MPATRFEQKQNTEDESFCNENEKISPDDQSNYTQQSLNNLSASNISIGKSDSDAILETHLVDPDDRLILVNEKKSLSLTSVNSFTRPNVQLYSTSLDPFYSQNE